MSATPPPTGPVPEATLHAWVDDRLSPPARAAVDAWLAQQPEQLLQAQTWRAQTIWLREAFPLPEHEPHRLRVPGLDGADVAAAAHPPWWRHAALAATVALVFVGGLIVGRASAPGMDLRAALQPGVAEARVAVATTMPRQAAAAFAAYAPEVRHPVEVTAAEEQHLVQWLTKRLALPSGVQLKAPVLTQHGWRLLGGRLLPASVGPGSAGKGPSPVALLMYENAAGKRLTLLVRHEADNAETGFSFVQEGSTRVFYWVDGPFGYAVAADIPHDELSAVARDAYKQLAS